MQHLNQSPKKGTQSLENKFVNKGQPKFCPGLTPPPEGPQLPAGVLPKHLPGTSVWVCFPLQMTGTSCGCRVMGGERASTRDSSAHRSTCRGAPCAWSSSTKPRAAAGWRCRWCAKPARRASSSGSSARTRAASGNTGASFCPATTWSTRWGGDGRRYGDPRGSLRSAFQYFKGRAHSSLGNAVKRAVFIVFLPLPWQLNDTLTCYSECAYLYTQTWFFVPPIAFYTAEIFPNKCFFSPFYFRLLSGRLTKEHRSQENKHKQTLHTGEKRPWEPLRLRGREGNSLPAPSQVFRWLLVLSGQQTREIPK